MLYSKDLKEVIHLCFLKGSRRALGAFVWVLFRRLSQERSEGDLMMEGLDTLSAGLGFSDLLGRFYKRKILDLILTF